MQTTFGALLVTLVTTTVCVGLGLTFIDGLPVAGSYWTGGLLWSALTLVAVYCALEPPPDTTIWAWVATMWLVSSIPLAFILCATPLNTGLACFIAFANALLACVALRLPDLLLPEL
jgi:hypothetical protein